MSRLWIILVIVCCVVLTGGQASTGLKTCKKMIRSMYSQCSMRNKRSPPVGRAPVHVQREIARRKRQIMSIREIIVSSRVPMYDIPYPSVSSYVGYEAVPIVPPTETDVHETSQTFEALPNESHSHVGFETDIDEITELMYEIFQRMPRSADPQKQKQLIIDCCRKGIPYCDCI